MDNDAFPRLLEELEKECPLCHDTPKETIVLGPNDIRLQPCGHSFDAQDWLDEMWETQRSSYD